MFILLDDKQYKATLTNIRYNNGLLFDIDIQEKKSRRSMHIKDINLRVNIIQVILDLISKKSMSKEFFNNLFSVVDFSTTGVVRK